MFERTLSLLDQELANTISSADRDELMEQMMMDPSIADELQRRERLLHANLRSDVQAAAQPRRPDWLSLSNAASLLVGAGVMLLVNQSLDESSPGLASANVYELDNVRSATPQIRPIRIQADEQWVNFMAYPDFADFTSLDTRIDLYTGETAEVYAAAASAWQPVWHSVSTTGSRDMLLLTVPAEHLGQGIHRLVVHGITEGTLTPNPVHEVVFALEYAEK